MIYEKYMKRLLDFLSSSLLFIAISPFFLVLTLMTMVLIGRPVFFKQTRAGKNEKPFDIIKFRTMMDERDSDGNLLPDEKRLTKYGRFLRTTSLDELPELINIIRGDMSVIGPRPLHVHYSPYFTDYERIRFNVRSGLIPPDSVDASDIISWEKQFKYEAEYAQKVTFRKDIRILLSVFNILKKRQEDDYGSVTREPLSVERAYMKKEKTE